MAANAILAPGWRNFWDKFRSHYMGLYPGIHHMTVWRLHARPDWEALDDLPEVQARYHRGGLFQTDEQPDPPRIANNYHNWLPIPLLQGLASDFDTDTDQIRFPARNFPPLETVDPEQDDYRVDNNQVQTFENPNRSEWRRVGPLGSGSHGKVFIWGLYDAKDNLVDTMAAKDVDYTRDWHLLSAWGNASQDIPREVMAHRSATRRAGTGENHIVQYRGFHLNRHQRYFRLGMELVPLSTFMYLGRSFAPDDDRAFRQMEDNIISVEDEGYEPLPTLFLWDLLHVLVEALQHLRDRGIVHRDLNCVNILIGEDDEDEPVMNGWGIRPLVCDFGSAIPLNPPRYENPYDCPNLCARYYEAPEQQGYQMRPPPVLASRTEPGYSYPNDERTDIYSLGMLLYYLLIAEHPLIVVGEGRQREQLPIYTMSDRLTDAENAQRLEDVLFGADYTKNYIQARWFHEHWALMSPDLIVIVRRCLQFKPADRYSLDELADFIDIDRRREVHTEYPLEERPGVFGYLGHLDKEDPAVGSGNGSGDGRGSSPEGPPGGGPRGPPGGGPRGPPADGPGGGAGDGPGDFLPDYSDGEIDGLPRPLIWRPGRILPPSARYAVDMKLKPGQGFRNDDGAYNGTPKITGVEEEEVEQEGDTDAGDNPDNEIDGLPRPVYGARYGPGLGGMIYDYVLGRYVGESEDTDMNEEDDDMDEEDDHMEDKERGEQEVKLEEDPDGIWP